MERFEIKRKLGHKRKHKETNWGVGCLVTYTSDRGLMFRLYKELKRIKQYEIRPLNGGLQKQIDNSPKTDTIRK